MTEQPRTERKPPRRWLRFSLRTFLVFTVVVSIGLGWFGNILVRVRRQRAAIARVEALGGLIQYDYDAIGQYPPGPKLVQMLVGDDAFAHVDGVQFSYEAEITDDDLIVLAEFPKLTSLGLNRGHITDRGLEHVLQARALRNLDIANTRFTGNGVGRLRSAATLESLSITGDGVTKDLLAALPSFPNLRSLYIHGSPASATGWNRIAEMSELTWLEIKYTATFDDDAAAQLANLRNLEFVSMHATSVTDKALQHLNGLTELRSLDLGRNRITGEGMSSIAELPKLTAIDLESCDVDNEGLAGISTVRRLEHLNLQRTNISDEGMVHIANMPGLQGLDISQTDVTDLGIERLKSLEYLTWISVGPLVTEDAAKRLRESLPNCSIEGYDKVGRKTFSLSD